MMGAMSPRRRALFAAIGALAAALLVVVLIAVVRGGDPPRAVPAPDRPGPVLLVPGYGGGTGSLTRLAQQIRRTGREATVVTLPGDGTGDLRTQAAALDRAVTAALDGGAGSVDVIGYSAGGVVARLWAGDHDGAQKARRIVTLGSPHHGADLAAAGAAAVPGACPVACQQLAPGSALLSGLAAPVATPPAWLSVWTRDDETVRPPDSARLDGAVNVPVQEICPERRVSHSELPTDPVVTRIVLAALGGAPLAGPDPSVCATS
jgi:triacylglycerol lipase